MNVHTLNSSQTQQIHNENKAIDRIKKKMKSNGINFKLKHNVLKRFDNLYW